MRRKRLGIVSLISLVALVVLAVGISASTGSASTDKATKGHKIFFLPKLIGVNVFTENGKGAKEAAAKLGDSVTYNGPTEAVAAKQVPFIDSAARQGYDAIIISANDPNAVAPALKRAQQRGLKVISYDGDVRKDARTIFVSPPTASAIGAFQVEWMGAQIGYKGEIAILSATPTAANQNTWIKFMKATLKLPKYQEHEARQGRLRERQPDRLGEGDAGARAGVSEPEGDHLADDRRHLVGGAGARPGRQVQVGRADRPRPSEPDAQVREEGMREEVRALERA